MYLLIKDTLNFIKIKLILPLILLTLFLYSETLAEEKFVGFIDTLEGDAFIIKDEDEIKLKEFDQIFIQDKIRIEIGASIIVSFIDNSLLTLKNESEFIVQKFDQSSKPSFILSIPKGKFSFESGSIAKNKNGLMKIKLSGLDVKLNGTLIVGQNFGGSKNVSLVEDSTGNLGTLEIGIEGNNETKIISESATGVTLNFTDEEQEALIAGNIAAITTSVTAIEETQLSEEERNEIVEEMKEVTIKSTTKSEENIERAITKQLADGTIPDANGDGVTDLADVEAYKAELLGLKKSKLDFVVEQSKEDLSLLSDIIVNSDSDQSMQLMENMMETNSESASLLMTEIIEQEFDIFSHVASAETGNFEDLRETIVTEMIQDGSDFVADTMAQIMAVSDTEMGSYLMNEITNIEQSAENERNLAMDVLATFTEVASEKMDSYMQNDPSIMTSFAEIAFANADENDAEIIADMMQQTDGKNSAYLMSTMMAANDEIIGNVYENLAEQEFDIFNHIETAKMDIIDIDAGPSVSISTSDPLLPTTDSDIFTADNNQILNEENFIDNLKGEIFTKIIETSNQTAAEMTAELMMNSEGDSAKFMMETMMDSNPEIIGEVMENFVEEDFDIFDHFEDTTIEEPTEITSLDIPLNSEINDPSVSKNKKGLTKEERIAAKAERKAEKRRIKAEKKAARLAAKAERKAARKAAKLAAKQAAQEIGVTESFETNPDLQELKTEVFQDMMTYSNESTMETMAQLVVTADESTATLIFETVVTEQQSMSTDDTASENNFALDLMSNLSNVDSSIVTEMYETQEDLVDNMMSTALSNISSEDSEAIANIISSSGNDEINEIVFNNIASSNDQNLTSNVFSSLANTEDGAEAIIAIASTNQSLYENIAQDIDPTMTAASLYANTTAEYTTAAATAATTTNTDTTTYEAGGISWTTYPMTTGTYSTSTYISINGTATSMNGVNYSASDLPDGLTLDYTSGLIFGTPTSPGSWNSTITATDMMDSNTFATASLSFDIIEDTSGGYDSGGGTSFSFMSTPYPPATLTVNNSITPIFLYTTGGVGNINFTATGLPMGLFISGDQISGSPDTQTFSSSSVNIIATDEDGNTASTNITFPKVDSASAGGGGSATGPIWTTYLYGPTTLTVGTEMMDMFLDATGTGSLSFTASNLPPGLYVDGQYIKGSPTMENMYSVSVMITATDDNGSQTKYVNFPKVDTSGGGTVDWNTLAAEFPSTLIVDDPISSVTLSATGSGVITYDYSGTLPEGLFLTAGILSGTPTTEYEFTRNVTFTATDSDGNTGDLLVTFPQVDGDGGDDDSEVTWNTTSADITSTLGGSLTVDTAINSVTLSATGNGTITYSQIGLPPGLTLTAGLVSGTPTTQDPTGSTVTFTAEDDEGNTEDLVVSFPPISASSGGSVTWFTSQADFPSTMTKGTAISSITLSATGNGAITYTDDGNLPNGISLTAGIVSGTPQNVRATETTVTFTAEDIDGNLETLTVSFPIISAASGISNPNWVTTPTTSASYTTSSNISISAEAVSVPAANGVIYSASSLPPGVTLDTATGLISGTPTTAGTYTSEIKVEDATDSTFQITETLTFMVSAGGSETLTFDTAETLPSVDAGESISETIQATASLGSPITYTFISVSNTGNSDDTLAGTGITITGNLISGIAPSLFNAATYSFEFQVSINAGATTNNKTFKMDISQDNTCVSPTNNICI
tara:strand:+ start:9610 stop:14760 length:5151 start_codon:yes stop_codon:yes gene_type:complete